MNMAKQLAVSGRSCRRMSIFEPIKRRLQNDIFSMGPSVKSVSYICRIQLQKKNWGKKMKKNCLLRRPAPSQSKKCCPVHLCDAPCIMYNVHITLTLRNWSSTSIHLSWRSTWYIRASNWPENTKNALLGWYIQINFYDWKKV